MTEGLAHTTHKCCSLRAHILRTTYVLWNAARLHNIHTHLLV